MVKKTNVKSKKFYIIIATLCILSLHILDWTQTFNPTIQTNIEYLIILVILIAVPINPFYCSITIFIACILIYVIDDSYWITCYPFLFFHCNNCNLSRKYTFSLSSHNWNTTNYNSRLDAHNTFKRTVLYRAANKSCLVYWHTYKKHNNNRAAEHKRGREGIISRSPNQYVTYLT